jgi:hypothetical protein
LTNDTHPLAGRILRKKATSFYECYTSSASLRAYYSNDIFMPYLDGLFDITNRIAEEGKMAGALAGEKKFQLVKVPYGSTDENIYSLLQRFAQAFLQT